jgi:hypothetical protein
MRKSFPVCILLGFMALTVPKAAFALGIDVEVKGGAGIGLGTTDNKDIEGAVRLSGGAGIDADIYFLEAGPIDLGICVGIDYAYLSFHSKWKNYLSYPTSQTTDSKYNYINFPVMIVGSLPINSTMRLFVKAGGFVGYFVGGTAELSYNPQIPPYFTDTDADLDSSNTNRWEWGLNFVAGVDIPIGANFSLTPQLLYNMGLTDTTKSFAGTSFKDTFWALMPMVGIKYRIF